MLIVLVQMMAIIVLGVAWHHFRPGGSDNNAIRGALTSVVYYLFLPALVLIVLWKAPLGINSINISIIAAATVFLSLCLSWFLTRLLKLDKPMAGAILLASSFPNATYLGLPVLETVLGPWAQRIAIQYDLFACTPILLTLGVLLAERYGGKTEHANPLRSLLKVPPLWAAVVAVVLNLMQVPVPTWLDGLLNRMAVVVTPLMLLALGISLEWRRSHWRLIPKLIPVSIIQLVIAPLFAWFLISTIGIHGAPGTAIVLEAAMPSMLLGIVLCDRYGLNTNAYAGAVTLTTLLSMASLPVWLLVLQ
ncbi:MAG: AEC family transporter, partial [Gammaproteobacteria bacterium]|nr:AEC family transporter [Gammaproteobacteria bacterium]